MVNIWLYWFFFTLFGIKTFLFIAGPEITLIREIDAIKTSDSNMTQENFLANGPFKIQSGYLSTYARQLWLFSKYQIENTESEWKLLLNFSWKIIKLFSDEIFDSSFLVNVQIKGLENLKFRNINNYWPKNRTRHLKCKGSSCEEFTVVHLGWLDYSHYQFLINFYGLNSKRYSITKLTFYVSWTLLSAEKILESDFIEGYFSFMMNIISG